MFMIGGFIVGYLAGIASYYYVSHRAAPTETQVTVDAAKAAVTAAIDTHVAAAETAVKADIASVL